MFSAYLHMDEATPHLHIDFIPYTTGSKRGLETLSVLCLCPHIVLVAYLQNNLMEWLFLFAGTDFLIVGFAPILPELLMFGKVP